MSVATTARGRILVRERDREASAARADVGDDANGVPRSGRSSRAASTMTSVSGLGMSTAGDTSKLESPEFPVSGDVSERLAPRAPTDERIVALFEVRRRRFAAGRHESRRVPAERVSGPAVARRGAASESGNSGVDEALPSRATRA